MDIFNSYHMDAIFHPNSNMTRNDHPWLCCAWHWWRPRCSEASKLHLALTHPLKASYYVLMLSGLTLKRSSCYMGVGQNLLLSILMGWTSIYQLFWCSPGVQGFDTLPYQMFMLEVWTSENGLIEIYFFFLTTTTKEEGNKADVSIDLLWCSMAKIHANIGKSGMQQSDCQPGIWLDSYSSMTSNQMTSEIMVGFSRTSEWGSGRWTTHRFRQQTQQINSYLASFFISFHIFQKLYV